MWAGIGRPNLQVSRIVKSCNDCKRLTLEIVVLSRSKGVLPQQMGLFEAFLDVPHVYFHVDVDIVCKVVMDEGAF